MAILPSLFLIIFLEGYIVLSVELLAIRLLLPFTGSGTDTVSVIIAAVLLPLAFGYFAGGRFKVGKNKTLSTVRKKLVFNLLVSAALLTPGLSFVFLNEAFPAVYEYFGWSNRILLTTLYCAIFVIGPIFLLGQTVPLISNYFSRERFPLVAGRMLFFSTLGSFMGAIFSTLVLMSFAGVHHTVTITVAAISLLIFIISKKKISQPVIAAALLLLVTYGLNSGYVMESLHIVSNNKYSTVQVIDTDGGLRELKLNGTFASVIYQGARETVMDYTIYIEDNFLVPVFKEGPEKSFLILGAGGFTIGREDIKNKYTYVDIDADLKHVAEDKFLQEKLTPNKKFFPMDARAFLTQNKDKYDLILLDLFRDPVSVHENLVTLEFFQSVKAHLKEGGIMLGNYWASPTFADAYSRNLDYTLHAAFPNMNRQIINSFNAWDREKDWTNVIYSAVNYGDEKLTIYTDNKNTVIYDKPSDIPRFEKHSVSGN